MLLQFISFRLRAIEPKRPLRSFAATAALPLNRTTYRNSPDQVHHPETIYPAHRAAVEKRVLAAGRAIFKCAAEILTDSAANPTIQ